MIAVADIRGDGLGGVADGLGDGLADGLGDGLTGRMAVQVTIPQLTATARGRWPPWCGRKISTTPAAAARPAPVPIPQNHRCWASTPSHGALVKASSSCTRKRRQCSNGRVGIAAKRDDVTAAASRRRGHEGITGYQPTATTMYCGVLTEMSEDCPASSS
jgi:hypothetical protein